MCMLHLLLVNCVTHYFCKLYTYSICDRIYILFVNCYAFFLNNVFF